MYCGTSCANRRAKLPATVVRRCAHCGDTFDAVRRGADTARYCTRRCVSLARWAAPGSRAPFLEHRIAKNCEQCGLSYSLTLSEGTRRRFCSRRCAGIHRMAQPEAALRKTQGAEALRRSAAQRRGRANPEAAARMRASNPMADPAIREKAAAARRGRSFIGRGGNGKLTVPQKMLAKELELPTEYAIGLAEARMAVSDDGSPRFESVPTHYKVDLAAPEVKLAIEVDGRSHLARRWRFLDRRKTEILESLGWTVVRYTNEEILDDLPRATREVRQTIRRLEAGR